MKKKLLSLCMINLFVISVLAQEKIEKTYNDIVIKCNQRKESSETPCRALGSDYDRNKIDLLNLISKAEEQSLAEGQSKEEFNQCEKLRLIFLLASNPPFDDRFLVDAQAAKDLIPLFVSCSRKNKFHARNNRNCSLSNGISDLDYLKASFDAGCDVNEALHSASSWGSNAVVNFLLENQAYVNTQNAHGSTPSHEAAFYGNTKNLESLIKYGADLTIKDGSGMTVLDNVLTCCSANQEEILGVLLKSGQFSEVDKARSIARATKNMGNENTSRGIAIVKASMISDEEYLRQKGC